MRSCSPEMVSKSQYLYPLTPAQSPPCHRSRLPGPTARLKTFQSGRTEAIPHLGSALLPDGVMKTIETDRDPNSNPWRQIDLDGMPRWAAQTMYSGKVTVVPELKFPRSRKVVDREERREQCAATITA